MAPGARQLEERVERRRGLGDLRLGRPAAAHRDDDDVAVAREQPRDVARDRGLPDALARPDHGERRQRERLERGGVEAEVGARRTGARARARGSRARSARAGPSTGSSERSTTTSGSMLADRLLEVVDERHAVVLAAAELLRAAGEHGADEVVGQLGERVAHDRRVVLAVDHGDRPRQRRVVTSPSIRAVYFSNSSVSVENWMICLLAVERVPAPDVHVRPRRPRSRCNRAACSRGGAATRRCPR